MLQTSDSITVPVSWAWKTWFESLQAEKTYPEVLQKCNIPEETPNTEAILFSDLIFEKLFEGSTTFLKRGVSC